MSYFDDDYEEYYEYEERVNPVEIVSELFNERLITETLADAGLVGDRAPWFSGTMERLVFVHGDDNEVYSSDEIEFIESVTEVYAYSEQTKRFGKHAVPGRVFATKFHESGHDAITSCVSFEKIIDKAFDGFNIFFFVTEESVYFGCRIFDKGNYDCTLSNPIMEEEQFQEILEAFACYADADDFVDYYQQIQHIISIGQEEFLSYADSVAGRGGTGAAYFDTLDDIGRTLGVDVSGAKSRYWNDFYGEEEPSFNEILDEVCENLSFIKSHRINIYEMLFEADEAMKQAEATEAANQEIASSAVETDESDLNDDVRALLDDPEEMIKLLKKRKGL